MCHAHYDCSYLNRNRIKIPWMQNFEMATIGYNYYTPSPSSKASHCGHSCCTFCFLVFVFPAFPCVLHFLAWEECVCDFGKSYLWLFFDKKLLTLGTLPSSLPSSESGTVHLLGQRGPWRLWLLPLYFCACFTHLSGIAQAISLFCCFSVPLPVVFLKKMIAFSTSRRRRFFSVPRGINPSS